MREQMELFLIGASNKGKMMMRSLAEKIADDEEGANTVEVVMGIAIFAVVALLVSKTIGNAIEGKANEAAAVIESASFK